MALHLVLAFIFGYDAEFVCGTLRLKDEELANLLAARPGNYVLRQKDMRFS